jgi:hypothetical protein
MVKLEFPPQDFRMKEADGKEFIFDEIRRLWVRLTPEEWVRQNFLQYLTKVKNYPSVLIAIETEIRLNELRKRCDIVVYRNEKPWMIIECKEMNVPLAANVMEQVLRYNIPLAADYLAITNGSETYLWRLSGGEAFPENNFPSYSTA